MRDANEERQVNRESPHCMVAPGSVLQYRDAWAFCLPEERNEPVKM
jgi:hypothetical protein